MLPLLLGAIVGGLIVLLAMKFPPEKPMLKLALKTLLGIKDYVSSVAGDSLKKFKDFFAETKAEYEAEKKAERQAPGDVNRAEADEKHRVEP